MAPWYHQGPIFFLHHLWRWNTAASEESTLCRTTMYTILPRVVQHASLLKILHPFSICQDASGAPSISPTFQSTEMAKGCFFQPSLLLWRNLVGNFLQHFHLYSGQNLIMWLFTAIRKHVMYSPVLDTLPSQIKLSLYLGRSEELILGGNSYLLS